MAIELVAGESATRGWNAPVISVLERPALTPVDEAQYIEEQRLIVTLPLDGDAGVLLDIRKKLHTTQEKFAELLEMPRMQLHAIEKEKRPFITCQRKTLLRIARGMERLGIRLKIGGGWELIEGGALHSSMKPLARETGCME